MVLGWVTLVCGGASTGNGDSFGGTDAMQAKLASGNLQDGAASNARCSLSSDPARLRSHTGLGSKPRGRDVMLRLDIGAGPGKFGAVGPKVAGRAKAETAQVASVVLV